MMRGMLRKEWVLVVEVAILGLIAYAAPMTAVARPTGACADDTTTCSAMSGQTQGLYFLPISVEYEQQLVLTTLGPDAVTHMLHRVATSTNVPAPQTSGVTQYDTYWGGYFSDLSGTSFRVNHVQGTFNAANYYYNRDGDHPILGTWIGIGGYFNNSNLMQTGVNQSTMQAFWEIVPNATEHDMFTVNYGDSIQSEVTWDAGTRCWLIYTDDLATGYYGPSSEICNFAPDQTTADWAVEDTTGNVIPGSPVPPQVQMHFAQWEDQTSTTLRAINDTEVAIVRQLLLRPSGGHECVFPSEIPSNAESFYFYSTSC